MFVVQCSLCARSNFVNPSFANITFIVTNTYARKHQRKQLLIDDPSIVYLFWSLVLYAKFWNIGNNTDEINEYKRPNKTVCIEFKSVECKSVGDVCLPHKRSMLLANWYDDRPQLSSCLFNQIGKLKQTIWFSKGIAFIWSILRGSVHFGQGPSQWHFQYLYM